MRRPTIRSFLASLLLCAAAAATATAAAAGPGADPAAPRARADYESRLATVRSLAEVLRPRQREPGVRETLARVEASLRDAAEMAAVAEFDLARSMLDEGYATLQAAIGRLMTPADPAPNGRAALDAARPESARAVDSPDRRAALARRAETVGALRAACERIVDERSARLAPERRARYAGLIDDVRRLESEAARQATGNDPAAGLAALDRAYLILKVGIAELEGGEEVRAAKRFATPADEFRYEQGRNDDYAQLIDGLVEGARRADWGAAAAQARYLRAGAERAAAAGDYRQALREIGESTGTLKSILRQAGFPIL